MIKYVVTLFLHNSWNCKQIQSRPKRCTQCPHISNQHLACIFEHFKSSLRMLGLLNSVITSPTCQGMPLQRWPVVTSITYTQRSKSAHDTPILLLVLTIHPITQRPPPSQVTTNHPYTDGEIQSCALWAEDHLMWGHTMHSMLGSQFGFIGDHCGASQLNQYGWGRFLINLFGQSTIYQD